MSFSIQCPHCGRDFSLGDELRGKKLRCAGCRELFVADAPAAGGGPFTDTQTPARAPQRPGSTSIGSRPIPLDPQAAKPAQAAGGQAPRATQLSPAAGGRKAPLAMPVEDDALSDDPFARAKKKPSVSISIPPQLIKGVAGVVGLAVVLMVVRSFWPELKSAVQSATSSLSSEVSSPTTTGDNGQPQPPASDSNTDPATGDAPAEGDALASAGKSWQDGKPMRPGAELEAALLVWQESAEKLLNQLGNPADVADLDADKLKPLAAQVNVLVRNARAAGAKLPADEAEREVALLRLPVEIRQRVVNTNRALVEKQDQLKELDSVELNRSDLVSTLDNGLLTAWFEGGDSTAPAAPTTVVSSPAPAVIPPGQRRDFRQEARLAMHHNRTRDAERLMCADLLTRDDEVLLDQVKWCPGLDRFAAFVHFGIGALLKDVPQQGPNNLRPSEVAVRLRRSPEMEAELNGQLVNLTGTMGAWVAEGLHHRVATGVFGDWGREPLAIHEHRGSSLMDFGTLERMMAAAKAQNADVLLVFSMTWRGPSNNTNATNFARSVVLYNVMTGKKLFESEELLDPKIRSAYAKGKKPDAALVEKVLKYIDTKLTLNDAKPTDSQLQARLTKMAQEEAAAPIVTLVELRYMQLSKLITPAVALERMAALVGEEDAKALASDDRAARYQALAKLVPQLKPGE